MLWHISTMNYFQFLCIKYAKHNNNCCIIDIRDWIKTQAGKLMSWLEYISHSRAESQSIDHRECGFTTQPKHSNCSDTSTQLIIIFHDEASLYYYATIRWFSWIDLHCCMRCTHFVVNLPHVLGAIKIQYSTISLSSEDSIYGSAIVPIAVHRKTPDFTQSIHLHLNCFIVEFAVSN